MADFVRVPETDWQDICDSVREKTGGADGLLSSEVAPAVRGIESGGGNVSGVRCVQFTVTLEADSLYLPLDGLSEIPEMLSVDAYDEAMVNATAGYGNVASPLAGKITNAIAFIAPLKLVSNNSGLLARLHSYGVMEYQASSNLRGYNFMTTGTDRRSGAGIGWINPASLTDAHWQSAFISDVSYVGYALDAEGVLCLKNGHSTAVNFSAGIPYLVTALYDAIPDTFGGYANIDRTVNATNVNATV